jgi:D-alanine-D-alanine ligase
MLTARVLILYNQPVLARDHPESDQEYEVLDSVERVVVALEEAGYRVETLGIGTEPDDLVAGLRRSSPDVVFNLFEGLGGRGETEAVVAGLLEWLEIPFTGSPPHALCLGRDKYRTKSALLGAGLPTPSFLLVDSPQVPEWTGSWPVMVKPALQDASVGINQGSVVTTPEEMIGRVQYVLERYGPPVLLEEYIAGREIMVSLIDRPDWSEDGSLSVLPLAEIEFLAHNDGLWPIYSYEAKWTLGSVESDYTPLTVPVKFEPEVAAQIVEVSRKAYQLVGCRDYGRVDLRVTAEGRPYILEVNPNPFLHSYALRHGLEEMGRSHSDFITGLVRLALTRRGHARHSA